MCGAVIINSSWSNCSAFSHKLPVNNYTHSCGYKILVIILKTVFWNFVIFNYSNAYNIWCIFSYEQYWYFTVTFTFIKRTLYIWILTKFDKFFMFLSKVSFYFTKLISILYQKLINMLNIRDIVLRKRALENELIFKFNILISEEVKFL